jgi:hypothetical protein
VRGLARACAGAAAGGTRGSARVDGGDGGRSAATRWPVGRARVVSVPKNASTQRCSGGVTSVSPATDTRTIPVLLLARTPLAVAGSPKRAARVSIHRASAGDPSSPRTRTRTHRASRAMTRTPSLPAIRRPDIDAATIDPTLRFVYDRNVTTREILPDINASNPPWRRACPRRVAACACWAREGRPGTLVAPAIRGASHRCPSVPPPRAAVAPFPSDAKTGSAEQRPPHAQRVGPAVDSVRERSCSRQFTAA